MPPGEPPRLYGRRDARRYSAKHIQAGRTAMSYVKGERAQRAFLFL